MGIRQLKVKKANYQHSLDRATVENPEDGKKAKIHVGVPQCQTI